ncbi:MAG: hypothetical protein P1P85_04230 [Patescibacteria group bacterium]|nr:hypothetical protein [Patescibacteria group bacterium]
MECRKYLEIIEQIENIKAKIVKIKVKDKAEALSKLPILEKEFIGVKYIARLHICRHGENGNNQSCDCEILKKENNG